MSQVVVGGAHFVKSCHVFGNFPPIYAPQTGNFHTWKQAQVILALIFCIGEDSSVLPDHNEWREDGESMSLEETPAKICLRALVSALQIIWFLGKDDATESEIETCHIVLRNGAINAHLLHRLKQFVCNRKTPAKQGSRIFKVWKTSELTLSYFVFTTSKNGQKKGVTSINN